LNGACAQCDSSVSLFTKSGNYYKKSSDNGRVDEELNVAVGRYQYPLFWTTDLDLTADSQDSSSTGPIPPHSSSEQPHTQSSSEQPHTQSSSVTPHNPSSSESPQGKSSTSSPMMSSINPGSTSFDTSSLPWQPVSAASRIYSNLFILVFISLIVIMLYYPMIPSLESGLFFIQ